MIRRWVKNLLALGIGVVLALVLAELILRIYNPFSRRVRGREIVLPAGEVYEFSNVRLRGLDSHVRHSKNKLGFRGPEWSDDTAGLRIFCIGGSTTECFYLNDGDDWPAVMASALKKNNPGRKIWVNNAGLDGHSTRGHEVLLRDHVSKLKPDYIVFLVGCNDLAAVGFNPFEQYHLLKNLPFYHRFEVYQLYLNFRLAREAKKRGIGHQDVNPEQWPVADTAGWKKSAVAASELDAYRKRLAVLAELCLKCGARPVFVTQPCLLSDARDSVTGVYLGSCRYNDQSGLHYRARLDQINAATVAFCAERKFTCIRADRLLAPSSAYYYDFFHYTKAGSAEMGKIVASGFSANW